MTNNYYVTFNIATKIESRRELEELQSYLNEHSVLLDDLNLTLIDNTKITAKIVDIEEAEVQDWESV